MKPFLILAFSTASIVCITSTTMADVVCLDYPINNGSTVNDGQGNQEHSSLDGFFIGTAIPINNWQIGLEYFSGQDKYHAPKIFTNTNYTVKFGYAVVYDAKDPG
jgi:hypothetical protein